MQDFSVLYNPIAIQTRDCSSLRTVKSPTDSFNIYVIGSHHFFERLTIPILLLEALNRSGNYKLIIAGNVYHDIHSFIDNNVPSQVSNIIVKGSYSNNDLASIYSDPGILLHLKPFDPSPTVPLEAMSFGIPVICSGTGGMPELVYALWRVLQPDSMMIFLGSQILIPYLLTRFLPSAISLINTIYTIRSNYSSYSESSCCIHSHLTQRLGLVSSLYICRPYHTKPLI